MKGVETISVSTPRLHELTACLFFGLGLLPQPGGPWVGVRGIICWRRNDGGATVSCPPCFGVPHLLAVFGRLANFATGVLAPCSFQNFHPP